RRPPPPLLHRFPSVVEPTLRPAISTVVDEGPVFPAGDQSRGQAERLQPDLMPRPLIVEGETHPAMADILDSAGEIEPAQLGCGVYGARRGRLVGGQQRVLPQGVLDVRENQ